MTESPAAPAHSALRLFGLTALARTYPRVAWMFRNRTWLLQETLLPMLAVAAGVYVYRAMNAPPEFTGDVILGAAMMTFWMNVLWSMGAHLYWERDSGNLEIYVMSPAPMMGVLAGMALGGLTTTVVRALAIIGLGVFLFDVPVAPSSWWMLLLVFALTLASLYGLGMMFASIFLLFGREAWHTVNLLQEPVFLLTGKNFPIKALAGLVPLGVVGLSLLIPLTAGMDAMRQVAFPSRPTGLLPVWTEIGILAGLASVFLLLSARTLRFMEGKAKRDGKLTVKWQ